MPTPAIRRWSCLFTTRLSICSRRIACAERMPSKSTTRRWLRLSVILTRYLQGLPASPEAWDAETIRKLQDQMNAEGLLFEVRVLHSRMRHPRDEQRRSPPRGGTA